jgi:hypothetical protein
MVRVIFVALLGTVALCFASEPQPGTYVVLPKEGGGNYKTAYRAGRADATRDLQRNYFAVEIFGRQPVFEEQDIKLAVMRYGIHVKAVGGCVVDEDILGHAKGYNEISEPAIQRRFGKDVLLKTENEVQRQWEKKHWR